MDDPEEFKRQRARRSRRTALLLALIALAIYAGFFWKMGHQSAADKAETAKAAAAGY